MLLLLGKHYGRKPVIFPRRVGARRGFFLLRVKVTSKNTYVR